jgi:uncharacterized membrane protein YphA (DoxX/SURF4 family)
MNVTLTPAIIYSALGLCLLFVLLAAYMQKCSAKVFFILALRLAIGWHFMFEGLHKIHSYYVGPTDSNRVFTSEPYFAMADGPLGPIVRDRIGDPAKLIQSRIVAKQTDGKTPSVTAKTSDEDFIKLVPDAVKSDWDQYLAKFNEAYNQSDEKVAAKILAKYGRWITGVDLGSEAKIRYVQTDVPLTVPQRLAHIAKLEAAYQELKDRIKPGLGQGYGYDQKHITASKAELTTARAELLADADAMLMDMKKELFAKTAGKKVLEFPNPSNSFIIKKLPADPNSKVAFETSIDEVKFKDLISFTAPKEQPNISVAIPNPVLMTWRDYRSAVAGTYKLTDDELRKVDGNWTFWNHKIAEWFAGENNKKLKAAYEKAVNDGKKEDIEKAQFAYLAELDKQFATYKMATNNMISAETLSGVVPIKKEKPIEQMDKITMYFIAIVGACIFFGLLTRIACLAAVGFLVMTYLTHPPFPWLPLPPNTEGNPLFINKNVIEALALLVIAVHPTGKWLGLDSLLYRVFLKK